MIVTHFADHTHDVIFDKVPSADKVGGTYIVEECDDEYLPEIIWAKERMEN